MGRRRLWGGVKGDNLYDSQECKWRCLVCKHEALIFGRVYLWLFQSNLKLVFKMMTIFFFLNQCPAIDNECNGGLPIVNDFHLNPTLFCPEECSRTGPWHNKTTKNRISVGGKRDEGGGVRLPPWDVVSAVPCAERLMLVSFWRQCPLSS